MSYNELLEKYNRLVNENNQLKEENFQLKTQLGLVEPKLSRSPISKKNTERNTLDTESMQGNCCSCVDQTSDSASKIRLFMSLFRGRKDVYAKLWKNEKKGISGYSPVCLNQWRSGICGKPKIPCAKCDHKLYASLDENTIENHLRGKMVAGIYPMLSDETCFFLAMDFDETDWQKDISVVRNVCTEFNIPIAVERSRSGQGGHIWFFFENHVPVVLARRFGSALLTCAMGRRHEIQFKSYDRLFPSQDTIPKGGLGNLIALPLQKAARENKNSEFVDEHFEAHDDQWAFLSSVRKISEDSLDVLISKLCPGHELGTLKIDEEAEEEKPWQVRNNKVQLQKNDLPGQMDIVKANMLFVPKAGLSQKALNRIKRFASFKNPMFYRQQAMRLPTYGHSRVISCADETKSYLCLPIGCEVELLEELQATETDARVIDKTYTGKKIDVEFNGSLRDEQVSALNKLLQHDTGILSGTTAFGKTVVAIKLIAERKVNTLILVDKISLLSQWKEKLAEFLIINEAPPEPEITVPKKRGPKKKISTIGLLGGGKNTLGGIVDIAVMQSVSRQGKVKECVYNYGMIIADECHHASAFTYEQILKTAPARYIYGLTATPVRKDGHHPILFMHCGPVRYRDNPRKQAAKRPFDHYIVPRFTSFRVPMDRNQNEVSIQEVYSELAENEFRNQQIVEDVLKNYHQGRNCLILSLRTAHVQLLAKMLSEKIPEVITMTGGMGKKTTREVFQRLADIPLEKSIVLVATGRFIGEGFDEPRLDTLFLAMPISWKGTLQQYAGRLHRFFETKKEVRIYDYVDIQVKMLEKMYQKRLNGYASMGYKARGEVSMDAPLDIIFDKDNFLPVFNQDLVDAKKEIVIVSPFVRKRRTQQLLRQLGTPAGTNRRVIVITRPQEDFKSKDRPALQRALDLLDNTGISVVFMSNIHQKFAVMDQKVVWYGSINLLSYGSAQESIMRIESTNIAHGLMKSVEQGRT